MTRRLPSPLRPALLAAAFLVSACTVGPDYVRPDPPAQPAWRHVPENWKPAEPADKNHCTWKNIPVVCGPRGLPGLRRAHRAVRVLG